MSDAALEYFQKRGFDPREPRDYHGRWTLLGRVLHAVEEATDNKPSPKKVKVKGSEKHREAIARHLANVAAEDLVAGDIITHNGQAHVISKAVTKGDTVNLTMHDAKGKTVARTAKRKELLEKIFSWASLLLTSLLLASGGSGEEVPDDVDDSFNYRSGSYSVTYHHSGGTHENNTFHISDGHGHKVVVSTDKALRALDKQLEHHKHHNVKVVKSNPLWDGDGVQGAGQPRDRRGRWINFPGPTALVKAVIQQVGNQHHIIAVGDDRKPFVQSRHRSAKKANEEMARLLRADADAYVENQKKTANLKRRKEFAEARRENLAGKPTHAGAGVLSTDVAVPEQGRAARKPAMRAKKIEYDAVERTDAPGTATLDQATEASSFFKKELPDNEAKYAGLVARLLRKGLTQDPRRRGGIHDKYNISPKRQVEIENAVYDHIFPHKAPGTRRPNLSGGQDITTQQLKEMRRLGARKGTPEPDPLDSRKPGRLFRIGKGPDRGKWAKVTWNGHSEVISDQQAQDEISRSKIEWTKRMLVIGQMREMQKAKYRAEQNALKQKFEDDREALRDFKIAQAQKWAEKMKLDPDDSYWWAFFWNDPSLLRTHLKWGNQYHKEHEETTTPISVGLSAIMQQQHMDPALLEGILAMPDVDTHKMRGHRPEGLKARKGEEDFVPATPEARTVSAEHEASLQDARIKHERRIKAAYERYKKKHPKSRISLAEFTERNYNARLRIPGGSRRDITKAIKLKCAKCGVEYFTDDMEIAHHDHDCPYRADRRIRKRALNPFWDGDGLQGVGQPRGYHGRWVRLPGRHAFSKIGVWEHEDGSFGVYHDRDTLLSTHKTARAAEKEAARIFEEDRQGGATSRRGSKPWDHIKFKPVKDRGMKQLDVDGQPLAHNDMDSAEAAYKRNNGATKITNRRLAELHRDRSKATQEELDLLFSAPAQKHIDGDDPIRIWAVRRNAFSNRPRYTVMSDLAKELANDVARASASERGEGGQVIRRTGEHQNLRRKKVNAKNVASGRNKAESLAFRQHLLDEYGNGETAVCMLCNNKQKPVDLATISPERIRPGGKNQEYGGIYEKGNVAPSHWDCNVEAGKDALRDPEAYFRANLRRFLKAYGSDGKKGKSALKMHRKQMREWGLL